jgi:REP element-mobilizing transposase RayT
LHGDEQGSADDEHNIPGTSYLPPDAERHAAERERMDQPPYSLDEPRREALLAAIRQDCEHRGWTLHAVHVRSNHVHVVVSAAVTPERVMNDLKSYGSRRLNEAGFDTKDRKRWTRHGSTRYVWNEDGLLDACDYVLNRQGTPMSRWGGGNRSLAVAARTQTPRVEFEIFTPTTEKEVRGGTVSRAKATCLCCGTTLHPERVRAQLAAQRGGADVVFEPSPPTPLPEGEGSKLELFPGRLVIGTVLVLEDRVAEAALIGHQPWHPGRELVTPQKDAQANDRGDGQGDGRPTQR